MIYWTINGDEDSVFHTHGYVAMPAKALLNCALAQNDGPMEKFIREIMRRNVVKVAVVYLIAGWLTMQVADVMFPALNLPEWLTSAIAALLLIGFPFALIFAWAFEMTPEGIKREAEVDRNQSITGTTGKKLNHTIIIILSIALGFMLVDKFVLEVGEATPAEEMAAVDIKPSIAVLPFVNMSDNKDNEYFSDGLSEELLNLLAKIPQLHVAGRTSAFQFKGTNQDLRVIGEMLNVANVLEGSVRQSGTRLRITAQLIDAENGYHLWSNTYDRELTDVFAIQDEIAANVVGALRLTLLGEEAPKLEHGTDNIEAYNLYLRARFLSDQATEADFLNAKVALQRAIEIDPNYAHAYAELATVHQLMVGGFVGNGSENFIEGYRQVHEYADAALALDPDLPDALIAKANALTGADWNFELADQYYSRALQHDPNNLGALGWLSFLKMVVGKHDESIALSEKVLELDPLSIGAHRGLGDSYRAAGRPDDALRIYRRGLELQPDTARINGRIAGIALVRGDYESAAVYVSREPVQWARDMYAIMLNSKGENSDAFQAAAAAYAEAYGFSYQLAEIYGFVSDLDNAFKWLDKGIEVRDPGIPWAAVSDFLVSARDDPRWPDFLQRAGL
jgi:TolB-like protein/Tfp pilus assembly protein PilF